MLLEDERYRLIRGDCVRMLKGMASASVDAFVTDPPYGIDLSLQFTRTPKCIRNDSAGAARKLWERFVPEAARVAKPNTAHVFFCAWNRPWSYEILAEHFAIKGGIAWVKKQWGLGWHIRPRWELAYLCHKGTVPTPEKADCNVWEHSRDARLLHPAQKPIDMLRRAVRLVIPPGAHRPSFVVCDPFAGIASTGVAALEEGCRFIGSEIEVKYRKLGLARLAAAVLNQP